MDFVLPSWSIATILVCGGFLGVILENWRIKKIQEEIVERQKVIKKYGDYLMTTHHIGTDGKPLTTFLTFKEDYQKHITDAFRRLFSYPFKLGEKLTVVLEPNPNKELIGTSQLKHNGKNPKIDKCPDCAGKLTKRENHGQGCKTCESCNSIWFILYLKKECRQMWRRMY